MPAWRVSYSSSMAEPDFSLGSSALLLLSSPLLLGGISDCLRLLLLRRRRGGGKGKFSIGGKIENRERGSLKLGLGLEFWDCGFV